MFSGSDVKHKLKGRYDMNGQYHFHMELQCCLAVPTEDGLEVYPSSQWMDAVQIGIAKILNVPHNKCVSATPKLNFDFMPYTYQNHFVILQNSYKRQTFRRRFRRQNIQKQYNILCSWASCLAA